MLVETTVTSVSDETKSHLIQHSWYRNMFFSCNTVQVQHLLVGITESAREHLEVAEYVKFCQLLKIVPVIKGRWNDNK